MIENHRNEALLIRYADNLADANERAEVEALIQSDPTAVEFLQQLKATQLPFAEAFDRHLEAPSESLEQVGITEQTPTTRAGFRLWPIVATLIGGLLLGVFAGRYVVPEADLAAVDAPPEWVRLVADYHSLYVRETLTAAAVELPADAAAKISTRLSRSMQVPALDELGLQFRRSQTLGVGDDPLIQLTYLPESDKPVAVCILGRAQSKDQAVVIGEHATMRFAHWQTGRHAVVIVGELSEAQIAAVSEQVRRQLFAG